MASLRLVLFGGFERRRVSGAVVLLPRPRKKAQALLAYLACRPGQAHPRDKLAALLWPDVDDRQARASLRRALSALRPALSAHLRIGDDAVALNAAGLDVDVVTFERLIAEGAADALAQAADLYRGDLLEGLGVAEGPFEEWLRTERERLREGRYGEALAVLDRGAALAERDQREPTGYRTVLPPGVAFATWASRCHAELGGFDEAMGHAGRCHAVAEHTRHRYGLALASWCLGWTVLMRGAASPAIAPLEESVRRLEEGRYGLYAPLVMAALGSAYLGAGRLDDALSRRARIRAVKYASRAFMRAPPGVPAA